MVIPKMHNIFLAITATCFGATILANAKAGAAPRESEPLFPAVLNAANAHYTGGENSTLKGVQWGFVDSSGKVRIPPKFEQAWFFHGGLAMVRLNGEFGFVDSTGKVAIPPNYARARSFSEGRAAVCNSKNQWGFIDDVGHTVVDLKYHDVLDYSDGLAGVIAGERVENRSGFVDRTGRVAIPLHFWGIRPFSSGLAAVRDYGGTNVRFIRKDGTIAFPAKQVIVNDFHDGLARILDAGKTGNLEVGYLDTNGRIAIAAQFIAADDYHEGLAAAKSRELWGYIDPSGKFQIKPEYRDTEPVWNEENDLLCVEHSWVGGTVPFFSEGLAKVTAVDGWKGFIDKSGTRIVRCIPDGGDLVSVDYGVFHDGMVQFCRQQLMPDGKPRIDVETGYMKRDGSIVAPLKFAIAIPPEQIPAIKAGLEASKQIGNGLDRTTEHCLEPGA